jgi:hypothetical protein
MVGMNDDYQGNDVTITVDGNDIPVLTSGITNEANLSRYKAVAPLIMEDSFSVSINDSYNETVSLNMFYEVITL